MRVHMLMVLIVGVACGEASSDPPMSAPATPTALVGRTDITVAQFVNIHAEGVSLVDVRTPEEFASGHVPGAVNIPLDHLDVRNPKLGRLAKDEDVYVICEAGGRSAVAADRLVSAGYTAFNIKGGTGTWRTMNLPIEK